MVYQSTKTYGHEVGLSCAFRQWRAKSHCNKLHGYALSVKLTFNANELDDTNWVVDFGGLKGVKEWLHSVFDHTLLVDVNDPLKDTFLNLQELGGADVVVVDKVGCEAFAELIYHFVSEWLSDKGYTPRVCLESVEVMEHGANSAAYSKGGY